MRESSNLNLDLHHHHEDFHGPSSSSLAAPPPFHFVATSNKNPDWNQHLLLNNGDDQFMAPREFMPTVHDLGNILQWPATDQQGYMNMMGHCSQELVVSKGVKEELPESTLARLAGVDLPNYHLRMPPSPSPSSQAEVGIGFDDGHPMGSLGCSFGGSGMSFGTVLPTANISAVGGPNQLPALPYSNALDLFSNSGGFGGTLCQPAAVDHNMAYGLGQLQEPAAQVQASLSQKQVSRSSFSGARDSNANLEYKATQSVAKKPRLESRASFTPFKVRKEKLGDRIAALQQLVAPFGKTDTASVLMEAIGYIKFLQDQVATLSVPYMRSSNNKKMRTSVETSTEEREEPKLDLRSRGLCLVPLSCTSYVTTDENGGVWSPPNHRGGATWS